MYFQEVCCMLCPAKMHVHMKAHRSKAYHVQSMSSAEVYRQSMLYRSFDLTQLHLQICLPWHQANCHHTAALAKVWFVVTGAVRRIRGVAHSMRVSPQSSNRMVDGARSVLNDFLADVYIFTDHMTGPEAGQSPGYGLMLVAETTTGCYISSECTADTRLKVCPLTLDLPMSNTYSVQVGCMQL